MNENPSCGFERHDLDGSHSFFAASLPAALTITQPQFDELWALHPEDFHEIMIHGRPVKTPRWQQAYLKDYEYTGNINKALPHLPPALSPLLAWVQRAIDGWLNGVLLNWYEGGLGHYIGAHRDSREGLIEGAPIVTVSLGQERTFRLRPWKGEGFRDFPAKHGTVFVMPYDTNLTWTHEVLHAARHTGRRISVTF